jgi:hypothetical protein
MGKNVTINYVNLKLTLIKFSVKTFSLCNNWQTNKTETRLLLKIDSGGFAYTRIVQDPTARFLRSSAF